MTASSGTLQDNPFAYGTHFEIGMCSLPLQHLCLTRKVDGFADADAKPASGFNKLY